VSFLNHLAQGTGLTYTENGAVTNKSSLDAVVDFFGLAGAMRATPNDAVNLFEKAYCADPQTALRTLFYLRDVRGGQGEREIFRRCMTHLGRIDADAHKEMLKHIAFYGRWDDLLSLWDGTDKFIPRMVMYQINQDLINLNNDQSVSLLAKWMPSANATSKATVKRACQLRAALGWSAGQYRHTLSALRKKIGLLEQDMSANNWDAIDFSKLPSQAHRRHVKAFNRHLPEKYSSYLESVKKGERKINVKALYPYEVYKMAHSEEDYAEAAWTNLPDYTNGTNALVMADVSGSMFQPYNSANPIAVSVSLALYFAERNKGAFHNYFMTFSAQPQLVKVTGKNLAQKIRMIEASQWDQNTNFLAALQAILEAAVRSGSPGDVPKVLYVISDMEFDSAVSYGSYHYETRMIPFTTGWGTTSYRPGTVRVQDRPVAQDTVFNTAKQEYEEAGIPMPHVVFWNVNARQKQAPATIMDGNVSLVSGLSPTIFAHTVEGKSPLELVHSVVDAERYQRIVYEGK
jgi:Domain of unknown function (DUF2828)